MNNINKKRNINGTASNVTPSAVSMSYLDDLSSTAVPTTVTPAVVDGGGYVASLPKAASVVPAVSDVSTGGYVDRLSNPVVPTAVDGSGGSSVVPTVVDGSGGGSSGDSGSGGVSYTGYTGNEMTSKDYLSEYEQRIYHDFNLNQQYAENVRKEALENAEAARKSAKLEAEANFRQNAANYGIRGEQMLSQGLAGGGYSDFLEGKNMETRADSYSIANADYNAAVEAANDTYTNNLLNARAKLSADELTLLKEKKAIYDAIAEEKKLIFEQLFAKVENGDYTTEEASQIFAVYGTLTDAQKSALEAAYGHYLRDAAAMAADAHFTMIVNTRGEITRQAVKNWFMDTLHLTEPAAEDALSTMFDANGNYIYKENVNTVKTESTGWTESDLKTHLKTRYPDASDDVIAAFIKQAQKNAEGKIVYKDGDFGTYLNGLQGSELPSGEGDTEITETVQTGEVWTDAQFDNASWFISLLKDKDVTDSAEIRNAITSAQAGGADQTVMNAINAVLNNNNTIVTTGAKLRVNDWDTSYEEGDNLSIVLGDERYGVESGGFASAAVRKAMDADRNIQNGEVFLYNSGLYMRVGDKAIKLKARKLFYKDDFKKLFVDTVNQRLNDIGNKKDTENDGAKEVAGSEKHLLENHGFAQGAAKFADDSWGGPGDYSDGDNFNVEINDEIYAVQSAGEINDDTIKDAAKDLVDGDVFRYDDDLYMKKGEKIYKIEERSISFKSEYGELKEAILNNSNLGATDGTAQYDTKMAITNWKEKKVGDTIKVRSDENDVELKITEKLGTNSNQYKAAENLNDGQLFLFADKIYMKGDGCVFATDDIKNADLLRAKLKGTDTSSTDNNTEQTPDNNAEKAPQPSDVVNNDSTFINFGGTNFYKVTADSTGTSNKYSIKYGGKNLELSEEGGEWASPEYDYQFEGMEDGTLVYLKGRLAVKHDGAYHYLKSNDADTYNELLKTVKAATDAALKENGKGYYVSAENLDNNWYFTNQVNGTKYNLYNYTNGYTEYSGGSFAKYKDADTGLIFKEKDGIYGLVTGKNSGMIITPANNTQLKEALDRALSGNNYAGYSENSPTSSGADTYLGILTDVNGKGAVASTNVVGSYIENLDEKKKSNKNSSDLKYTSMI